MLRSPWLGVLAIVVAGVVGYALADGNGAGASTTIESVTITIRSTRDNGAAWDFGGGLPDPKITVDQAGAVLAECAAKDQLKVTCRIDRHVDRANGPIRVMVIDTDSSDNDTVGELQLDLDQATTAGTDALQSVDVASTGGATGPWLRFRALWIALAIGVAIAVALACYRRRHA